MRRTAPAVFALAVGLVGAPAVSAAKPVSLGPGQAVSITGTDVVCVHGGPANQDGVACLHTQAKRVYTFRIDETDLRVYKSGKEVGRWLQPKTVAQPHSPAVSGFKLVASVGVGTVFGPTGFDIACDVETSSGKPVAVCAKVTSKGPLGGGYGASIGPLGVIVGHYAKTGNGGSVVFTGKES